MKNVLKYKYNMTEFQELNILPVNKTTVFSSPIEGNSVLVRTGTIGDGSCFIHSILHACDKLYKLMDEADRQKHVKNIRKKISTDIDIEKWEELNDGIVSQVSFQENMHYNPYFPGMQISMAPPLSEGIVTYTDGTKATVDQMSRDVVNFLQWAADPKMEQRKDMGIKVLLFLFIFTGLFHIAKKRIWSDVK